jgi:hypothetical protein
MMSHGEEDLVNQAQRAVVVLRPGESHKGTAHARAEVIVTGGEGLR